MQNAEFVRLGNHPCNALSPEMAVFQNAGEIVGAATLSSIVLIQMWYMC
jgi:hypothetical protein